MITLGERLDHAMKLRGYNPNKLGVESGVHASTVKNYLTGSSTRPDNLKLERISNVLNVSYIWLKDGVGDISDIESINNHGVSSPEKVKKAEPFANKNGNTFIQLPNGQFYMTMPLAEFNIQAGLLDHYQDAEYLMDMEQHGMIVDKPVNGRYVAFRVSGDSMDDGTINAITRNSIVSTRELQKHHWQDKIRFRDFRYWVIYSTESKMPLLKEIVHHDIDTGVITCHSLNDSPEFEDFGLKLDNIKALFYVINVTRNVSNKTSY